MVEGFCLMAVKPVETETFHCIEDIDVKVRLRSVDRRSGGEISVVDKCVAKVRMGPDDLDVIGELHLLDLSFAHENPFWGKQLFLPYHISHNFSEAFMGCRIKKIW